MEHQLTERTLFIAADICIEPDGDSFYATCPAFEGLHTCGATEQEALDNVKNAIAAYVLSMIKHGEPLPCYKIIEKKKIVAMSRPRVKTYQENIPIPAWA